MAVWFFYIARGLPGEGRAGGGKGGCADKKSAGTAGISVKQRIVWYQMKRNG